MKLDVDVLTIPTDEPESDGTLAWDSTTIVVVRVDEGIGYTYCHAAAADVIRATLAGCIDDDVRTSWRAMNDVVRNMGRPGIAACAISAVDQALWDREARRQGMPLVELLGAAHDAVPIYGSGGFCSYANDRLQEQLGDWAAAGIPRVKMKVGRDPERDPARLDAAREAIGDGVELYVDANGAFSRRQALTWADRYVSDWNVTWLEEPVSSGDPEGLRLVRDNSWLDVTAGEYAYTPDDVQVIVDCVDVLQLDVTRCLGITGLLDIADEVPVDVSAHGAPAISAHAFGAVEQVRHLEWFHDHVRIESMVFDGAPEPDGGLLRPDRSRPGNGLELKVREAQRWAA